MADHNAVKFAHLRVMDPFSGEVLDPRGGVTIAYRPHSDGGFEIAVAQCSMKDNYNKATGRALAISRLLQGNPRWYKRFPRIADRAALLQSAATFYGFHFGFWPKSKHPRYEPTSGPRFSEWTDDIPF